MGELVRRTRLSIAVVAVTALVGSLLVPIVGAAAPAYADPTPPSSIVLAADQTVFDAGEVVQLTATTDVAVEGSSSEITIVDETTETEVASCDTGSVCETDIVFYTGGTHTYVAYVGSLSSAEVGVSRAPWTVSLVAADETVDAGQTTMITATANQDVGETNGAYQISIFDMTSGERLAVCSTGNVCTGDTRPFYIDDEISHVLFAAITASGSPATLTEADDVQAVSDPLDIQRAQWEIAVDVSPPAAVLGDTVSASVTVNQDVGETNGKYAIYLFNEDVLLAKCTDGTECGAEFVWRSGTWGIYVWAVVGLDGEFDEWGDPQDIQAYDWGEVTTPEWEISLSADKSVLAAGESVSVTATSNQDVGETDGNLAIYIVEWVNNTLVKVCTTGTVCTAVDRFNKPGDDPYADHAYDAVISTYVPGADDTDDAFNDGTRVASDTVEVDQLNWEVSMEMTGTNQFTVELNQDLGETNDQFGLYLFSNEDGSAQDSCFEGTRCLLTAGSPSSTGYFVGVVRRTDPPTSAETEDWLAGDGVTWPSLTGPIFGPVLPGEGKGGRNPSEKACQCAHADPVNTATGEFFENVTDIGIPGTGPALSVSRGYSSTSVAEDGPFGFGWSPNFDAHLRVVMEGDSSNPLPRQVEIVQENGSTVLFTRNGVDSYDALDRVNGELTFDSGSDSWTYVRDLTEFMTFDTSGYLTSLADPNGNAVTVTRDGAGKVQTLSASGGRELTLTWNGVYVTAITDSADRTVSYGYNSAGDLVSVTAVDGAITQYTYDADHYLLTITKPGGGVITNTYDATHRVIAQTDPIGRTTTFGYDSYSPPGTELTIITAADGSQIREVYSSLGVIVSQTHAAGTAYEATTQFEYDSAVNLISTTEPGGAVTTFTYNDDGRMLTQTDALNRTTTWTYDALGNVTSVTDPLSRETTYTYDGDGNLLTVEHPGGGIEEWTYNGDGTVATYEDARGKVTEYTYTAEGWVESVEDPLGAVTSSVYNDAGFVVATTDALLHTSEMTRDATGRVLTSTDPLDRTTTTTYDADGNLTSATDPEGGVTAATFDLAGQRTSKTDATGNVTTYTYTLGGQLATTTQPGSITSTNAFNALGQLISTTDPLARVTAFEYDTAGNLTTTTRPSGAEITDTYDLAGQLASRTDAAGKITSYEYDAAGQLISSTDPLNRETATSYTVDGWVDTVTLPDSSEITYDYDAAGNVTQVTDPDGYVTTNLYDDAGRLVQTERPGAAVTEYAYDLLGQLTVKTLPDSTTLTHDYDDAGQLIEIDPSVSGATAITYGYDDAGRRVQMVDSTGTTTSVFDAAGRLTSETDGNGNAVGYDYDALGRLTELTYPSNDAVAYSYNAAGEMVSLTDWNANTISFTWTLDGELATRIDPNGVTSTRAYSNRGELTSIDVSTTVDELLSIAYGYDDAGQLISREFGGDAYPDSAAEYEYDPLGQLAATDYSGDYESSSGGQLLQLANGSLLGYDGAQQLEDITPASGPTTAFTYDANGARASATTGSAVTDYEYNAYGALTAVDDGASVIEYEVDGAGLRRTRTTGSGASEFAWATRGSIPLLLTDGDHSYVYGPGSSPIAQVAGTGDIDYLHADIVGSTVLLANDDATATGYYEYSEYGAAIGTGGTLSTAMRYTGNWSDPVTGLLYLRARDYDPRSGQFISVDPLVSETQQPYAYASNNPLLLTDPLGLFACRSSSDIGCAVAAHLSSGSALHGNMDALRCARIGSFAPSAPSPLGVNRQRTASAPDGVDWWSEVQGFASVLTDNPVTSTLLTACGLVPGLVGMVCGGISTAAYAVQGRWEEAAYSSLSMLGAGAVGGALRLAATAARPVVATATNGLTRAAIASRTGSANAIGATGEFLTSASTTIWDVLEPTPSR